MIPRFRLLACALLSAFVCAASAASADPVPASEQIDRKEAAPPRLEGVDVQEHLRGPAPLDLGFTDESGKPVMVRDYFDGKLPVILTLNYSNCPMLCSLQLNALVDGLKKVSWTLGKDYRIVTVSMDPSETSELAHRTRARYLAQYGRPGAEGGWHFLHGSQTNIAAYARALGISFAFNEARKEYAHPATVVLTSPSGTINRYLNGIDYPDNTLSLSLVEASEGKIGSSFDRFVLYCFHYDSKEGRYAPVAQNIMRVGGAVTVFLLAGFILLLLRREKRQKKAQSPPTLRPNQGET
jgi:protein SCO1/2